MSVSKAGGPERETDSEAARLAELAAELRTETDRGLRAAVAVMRLGTFWTLPVAIFAAAASALPLPEGALLPALWTCALLAAPAGAMALWGLGHALRFLAMRRYAARVARVARAARARRGGPNQQNGQDGASG